MGDGRFRISPSTWGRASWDRGLCGRNMDLAVRVPGSPAGPRVLSLWDPDWRGSSGPEPAPGCSSLSAPSPSTHPIMHAPKPPSHLETTPHQLPICRPPKHHSPTDATDQPASTNSTYPPSSNSSSTLYLSVHPSIQLSNHLSALRCLPIIHSLLTQPLIHPVSQPPPTQHIQLPIYRPFSHQITIYLPVIHPSAHPVVHPVTHSSLCTISQPLVCHPSIIEQCQPSTHLPLLVPCPPIPVRLCPTRILSHGTHCARLSTCDSALGVPPPSVPPHGGQAQPLQGSHDHVDVIVAGAQEAAMGIQPGVWGQPGWGMVRA